MQAKLARYAPIIIVAIGFFVLPILIHRLFPTALPASMPALHEPRPVPAIEFKNGDGQSVTLDRFHGRAVLLNIWATWCGPCKAEMPSLNALAAHFPDSDLAIVPISVDLSGAVAVRGYYKQLTLDKLPIYVDPQSKAMHALGVVGIPTTLLIDRDGRETARQLGALQWDAPAVIDGIAKIVARPPS